MTPGHRHALGSAQGMRGLSLVELMVGIAVGLFVVAAAALMTSNQLSDNRRLLLETQLQQDLRATADLVARDIRRTAYWAVSRNGVPPPSPSAAPGLIANPYNALALPDASDTALRYSYYRASGVENFGFKLDGGVLKACQSDASASSPSGTLSCSSGYQDLSDGNTVVIDTFQVLPVPASRSTNTDPITLPCPNLCPDGTNGCWPTVALRELTIYIKGHSLAAPPSASASGVVREITASVRIRNLNTTLSSAVPTGQSCPAAP